MASGWSLSQGPLLLLVLLLLAAAGTVVELVQLQVFTLDGHLFDEYLGKAEKMEDTPGLCYNGW